MMHQLDAHVNTLHEWSRDISQNNARVLILTGSGGSFCAGLDIKQDDDKDVLQDGREMTQHMSRVTNCIQALPYYQWPLSMAMQLEEEQNFPPAQI